MECLLEYPICGKSGRISVVYAGSAGPVSGIGDRVSGGVAQAADHDRVAAVVTNGIVGLRGTGMAVPPSPPPPQPSYVPWRENL